jgi:hypothetical protein
VLRGWGEFRPDAVPLRRLAELNGQAVVLFDRSGWR